MKLGCFVAAMIFCIRVMAQTTASPTADSIYVHANIYTGRMGDASFHAVERA
jgi:hypothetical protein